MSDHAVHADIKPDWWQSGADRNIDDVSIGNIGCRSDVDLMSILHRLGVDLMSIRLDLMSI